MGLLVCPRCKAKVTVDSIEKGREKLDHSIGLYIGKPCQDGKAELIFTGGKTEIISPPKPEVKSEPKIETKKKKSKSNL